MRNFNFTLGVCAAAVVVGIVLAGIADHCISAKDNTAETATTETTRIEAPLPIEEAVTADTAEQTTEEAATTETAAEIEAEYISLGEYKLTAYCACEKCCGVWAENRPTDKDGNTIVYTASMAEAKQGVTVSADTNVLPFGTVVVIDGHEYTVQDRGSAVKGRHIDIFFESHEEAKQFGVQRKEIFIKGEA